jgi:hypothetical protein
MKLKMAPALRWKKPQCTFSKKIPVDLSLERSPLNITADRAEKFERACSERQGPAGTNAVWNKSDRRHGRSIVE